MFNKFKPIKDNFNTIKGLNMILFIWWIFKPSKYRAFHEFISKGMSINAIYKKLKR